MTDRAITPEQLATLSHEFRTPLNGILGMARLLDGTSLTGEQRAYVAALKESGDHLLSLVNDVLDLARLGEGRIEILAAPVAVDGLLRQVAELMSPRAQEKGIELAWACEPGAQLVVGDEGRLRQVLLNFAGNAVKFTETGGVLLTAAMTEQGLRLAVRDTGPGVPEAARISIFQPFIQADAAHGGIAFGGAGLGLAVAARLAEAMGGAVGVDAAPGGGAEFWLTAPLSPAPGKAIRQPLAGRRVGIATPNAVLRDAARRQIAALGGAPVAAESVDAVGPVDVLLLDRCLTGEAPPDGQRTVVLLRPDEREVIGPAKAAGFSGYLIKPLRPASLAERVLAALKSRREVGPAVEDERAAAAAAPGARVLLAEDNPINALLARALLEREGAVVDRAASGEETLVALEAGHYDLILMDVRMPGLSGLEATRALRQRGVRTPIVALTANAFEDDRRECLAAGMDDFLVKPLTPASLRAALMRWARWTDSPEAAKLAG